MRIVYCLDAVRPNTDAAVGEAGVGSGHLDKIHAAHTQRERRGSFHVRLDAQPAGDIDHVRRAGVLSHLHGDSVDRLRHGLTKADLAEITVGEVLRLPSGDPQQRVHHVAIGESPASMPAA